MCVLVEGVCHVVRWSTQGPSWGYLKVNSSETMSNLGDKCPQNGSKNEDGMPPRRASRGNLTWKALRAGVARIGGRRGLLEGLGFRVQG